MMTSEDAMIEYTRVHLVWVVHKPTGYAGYGRVEDTVHDETGEAFLIVRISNEMREWLRLADRYIDMRYAADEFAVEPMQTMPEYTA